MVVRSPISYQKRRNWNFTSGQWPILISRCWNKWSSTVSKERRYPPIVECVFAHSSMLKNINILWKCVMIFNVSYWFHRQCLLLPEPSKIDMNTIKNYLYLKLWPISSVKECRIKNDTNVLWLLLCIISEMRFDMLVRYPFTTCYPLHYLLQTINDSYGWPTNERSPDCEVIILRKMSIRYATICLFMLIT